MKHKTSIIVTLATALFMSSCTDGKVYDSYEHTPIAGWEKNDTLSFDIPKVKEAGRYALQLGLRVNESYPFMGLTLIVEQHFYPSGKVSSDTLRCQLSDAEGNSEGKGVNYYQYEFDVSETDLNVGDSLHVSVRHDMKREILPGISDVGIMLSRR